MSNSSARSSAIRHLRQQLLRTQFSGVEAQTVPTGFASLDALLPDHGLSSRSVIEWVSDQHGVCAMAVALRCAVPFLQQSGCMAVLDAQHDFFPMAAVVAGIPLSRILLIRPALEESSPNDHCSPLSGHGGKADEQAVTAVRRIRRASSLQADAIWALEQAARCAAVRVVVCRIDRLSSTVMRRLQLAVERSGCTVFLIRPSSALKQPSWADLRLLVRSQSVTPSTRSVVPKAQPLTVELLKARSAVTRTGRAELKIDYETGVVSEISELADSVSPAPTAR
ncbi:MAG: hypothetical protein KDA96_18330 [Planctomycetaceae bacterium]|nr:hypothetical protein [Planctomycetaceae bacterium]